MKSYFLTFFVLLAAWPASARADTFGSGENAFNIEFVTIGVPGNIADDVVANPLSSPLPSGTVDYTYRMAMYEISEGIIAKANALSDTAGDPLGLTTNRQRGPQKPATGLSWFDAARFVNWLNEDQGATPAYKFDDQNQFQLWESGDAGYNPDNPFRNTQAKYFLPSADEWHKAAYYDPVNDRYWLYPYGSDDPPTAVASGNDPGTAVYNQDDPADVMLAGGESPFGVVGLAGNVSEFEETSADLMNNDPSARRGFNGGSWIFTITDLDFSSTFRNSGGPSASQSISSIRIASIPEPNAALIMAFGIFITTFIRNHRIPQ